MYILIIFFMALTAHDGKAITAVSYNTKADCEKARTAVIHAVPSEVFAVCTYKGEEE